MRGVKSYTLMLTRTTFLGTFHTVTEGTSSHSYPWCCYGNRPCWTCCFISKAGMEARVKTVWKQTPAVTGPSEKACKNKPRQADRQMDGWLAGWLGCSGWFLHCRHCAAQSDHPSGPELTTVCFIRAVRLTPLITGLSANRKRVGTLGLINTSRLMLTSDLWSQSFNNTNQFSLQWKCNRQIHTP